MGEVHPDCAGGRGGWTSGETRPRFSSRPRVCRSLAPLEAEVVLWLVVTQVRLYMDCEEYHRVAFNRSPRPLTFEAGSGIFVGNAGGTGLTKFVVSWMLPILVFLMTSRFPVLGRPDLHPLKCLIPAVTC